jgi:hypothetical protein
MRLTAELAEAQAEETSSSQVRIVEDDTTEETHYNKRMKISTQAELETA